MSTQTQTEVVTLAFNVRIEYQSDAGREYLIANLIRDARVDMGGAGDVGRYAMKSVAGTARVTRNGLVTRALNDVIAAALKRAAAPVSSAAHEDAAIVALLELVPDWQPWSDEARALVADARHHMKQYRK